MIRQSLDRELQRHHAANETAKAGATDSESRAESKWDTQGLEASYLARGHARQFAEFAQQAEILGGFKPASYSGKPIGTGALVECDIEGYRCFFFLLPCCGGMELQIDGIELTVVTPESPLGTALLNKLEGEPYSIPGAAAGMICRVF